MTTVPEHVPDHVPERVVGVGRPDRPAVGWTEIVVAAVVYLVLQLGLIGIGFAAAGRHLPASPWLVGISAASAFGAVAVAVAVRVRSWAAVGLRSVPVRAVLAGVGVGLVAWIVSRFLIVAYVKVTGDLSDPQAGLAVFTGPVTTAVIVVVGGVIVPVGEETLFRGIGYGGLRRYGAVAAAIVSAAVFGLAHGLNVVLPAAFLLGIVNAVLYERTRSVWPSAASHATFNLLSFALALLAG